MKMIKLLGIGLLLVFGGVIIHATEKKVPTWEVELGKIDNGIERLTDLRNLELAKAARHQDTGDRLQFQNNQLMEARRSWKMAETSREIADRYQEEIDKLEVKRQNILKKHGVKEPLKESSSN